MTRTRCLLLAFVLSLCAVPATRADVARTGPEFQVNTYTTGLQSYPAVAGDAAGNFVVVWQSGSYYGAGQDGSRSGVYSQRHAANGTRLGGEFRVNTYTPGPQSTPAIGMAPSGDFVVAWTGGTTYGFEQDGSAAGAFVQRYDAAGTPVGPEFHANTYTPDFQGSPAVAVDGGGGFVVAWQSGLSYGPPGQDGSRAGIFAQRYDAAGTPLGGEFQVNTYTTNVQQRPAVAADGAGNFVVVWQSGYYGNQDGSFGGVFAQRFSSTGAPVGSEFVVNTYTTGQQNLPAVAMDPGGAFVVVWQGAYNQDGNGSAVFGQQFDASGARVGPEFQVNTYTPGNQREPSVATDPAGNFVVVWETYDYPSPDGDESGVFGQHFARTGDPLGLEFQVNTYTTGSQENARVAATGDDFVVAWQSSYPTQDGSGPGVFAQRLQTTGVEPPARVKGTRLLLRDDTDAPVHRRLVIRSSDDAIGLGGGEGSPDDPTLTGAQIRMRSATFDQTYTLPAANWSRLGPAGAARGFRYRDRSLLSGPIQSIQIRPGTISVVGRGAQLHPMLVGNPDPVTATIQMGIAGKRHCMAFGGRTLFQPGKLFRATDAPPPSVPCRL